MMGFWLSENDTGFQTETTYQIGAEDVGNVSFTETVYGELLVKPQGLVGALPDTLYHE